jgi:type IV secretory pathway VirB6-like protein
MKQIRNSMVESRNDDGFTLIEIKRGRQVGAFLLVSSIAIIIILCMLIWITGGVGPI